VIITDKIPKCFPINKNKGAQDRGDGFAPLCSGQQAGFGRSLDAAGNPGPTAYTKNYSNPNVMLLMRGLLFQSHPEEDKI